MTRRRSAFRSLLGHAIDRSRSERPFPPMSERRSGETRELDDIVLPLPAGSSTPIPSGVRGRDYRRPWEKRAFKMRGETVPRSSISRAPLGRSWRHRGGCRRQRGRHPLSELNETVANILRDPRVPTTCIRSSPPRWRACSASADVREVGRLESQAHVQPRPPSPGDPQPDGTSWPSSAICQPTGWRGPPASTRRRRPAWLSPWRRDDQRPKRARYGGATEPHRRPPP